MTKPTSFSVPAPSVPAGRAVACAFALFGLLLCLPATSAVGKRALRHGDAPSSVWDGIYTEEQATRGEPLYAQHCGDCHGQGLEGDDMSPPLVGSDFLWDWHGLSVGDLFERLRISMPEADPRSMTNQQKADVLAFMLKKNEIPAGQSELPPSTNDLKPIAFEAVPP